MIPKNIYAIVDTVADDIVGPTYLYGHDAPATRMFTDIAADKQTFISKHPSHYELVCLGHIDENAKLVANFRVVITGAAWADAQEAAALAKETTK